MTTRYYPLWALWLALATLSACDSQPKPAAADSTASSLDASQTVSNSLPNAMPHITHSNKDRPTTIGSDSYVWTSSRTANEAAPPIDIKGKSYYDNSIRLHVSTGSRVVFDRTFQKQDFVSYLSEAFRQNGLLINLVGIGAQGNNLKFIATIGYPDGIDDEAVQSITISLTPSGEMTLTAPQTDELEPPAHTEE